MSEPFSLSPEDNHLAEELSKCKYADWAFLVANLSESARDDLRAAMGILLEDASEQRGIPEYAAVEEARLKRNQSDSTYDEIVSGIIREMAYLRKRVEELTTGKG